MNIFTILQGLLLIGAVVFALMAIPCILWFGRKRSWTFRGMLVGLSLMPLAGALWSVDGSTSYRPMDPQGLAKCYQDEFGTPPPVSVHGLRAEQIVIGDAAGAWLRFGSSPGRIDELLVRFTPSDRKTFDRYGGGANTPDWWQPDAEGMTTFYVCDGWRKDFSDSHAVIAHDAAKHIVYFCHSASD